MSVVPKSWMPDCKMERIICHWTAGGYKASSLDRQHYHILIEANGDLVRGLHEIDDNIYTGDGDYAAHTKGCNTRSIGISVCCMANADEKPFKAGKFPMTQVQWEAMAAVAADLARAYGIPVSPKTVLGHGEVQANLGAPQNRKWDPLVLPWDPKLGKTKVGDLFRSNVHTALGAANGSRRTFAANGEGLLMAAALLNGSELDRAVFSNEDVLLPVADLGAVQGLTVTAGAAGQPVSVQASGRTFALAMEVLVPDDPATPSETWVSAKHLASELDAKLSFDPDRNVVALAWA
jgi:hypothetical protein